MCSSGYAYHYAATAYCSGIRDSFISIIIDSFKDELFKAMSTVMRPESSD